MGARCCVEVVRRVARNCRKTFDKAKDMCDHFASNPSNTGRTSTGGGEKNLKLETGNLKPEHMPAGAGWEPSKLGFCAVGCIIAARRVNRDLRGSSR